MMRNPVVAGSFYPGSADALRREVGLLLDTRSGSQDATGVVSPHAGYAYSGRVAGSVLSAIRPKPVYIIIGPNHTGLGELFGVDGSDGWKTPLGDVKVDRALADAIIKDCAHLKPDSLSHAHEHSIEVQLPFLQVFQSDFKIVPISASYSSCEVYTDIGASIAGTVKRLKLSGDVTIIASSDMTHYESDESARKKDSIAIEAMLKLDEKKLIGLIEEHDITMCGFAPAAIMIAACRGLGARKAKLVRYETSGDTSGDYSSVVGYAGIIIS